MKKSLNTSVVIPSFNEEVYLEPCLEALLAQSVPVFEIIVVDNNSDDGSIVRAKKKFPSVKFLSEKEQGIVFARNTGFDAARGDIIAKLDADSITYPDWHKNLLETIDGLDGWTGYVDNDELNLAFQPIVNVLFRMFTYRLNKLIAGTAVMFGSNLAMTKEAWQTIRGSLNMRNDIWEDLDMSLAMSGAGLRVGTSKFQGLKISARSANAPIPRFYVRTLGQPRVYWLRRRWLSLIPSLILAHTAFMVWLVLKPLSFIGKTINRRSRPEQY